jgi:transposase-like protein
MMGYGTFAPSPPTETPLAEEKKQKILDVIAENGGNVNRASVVLGISAASLRRRLAQWASPNAGATPSRPRTTREFYESIRSPWSVLSFDVEKREVCVEIRTPSSTNLLSFTVPSWKIPE